MFIPIGDDNTKRVSFPVVTLLLIIANGLVFWLELQTDGDIITQLAVRPALLLHGEISPLSVFYSMFLHGGWAHLIGNMLYLYVFGDNVEDNLGRAKFLLFYFLCGIGATLAQVFADPDSTVPMIGASGAISGVLAAYLFLYPRNRVRVLMGFFITSVSAWLVLGLWIATQLFAGYTDVFHREAHQGGGVAYLAHIGGFVTGVILVFVFRKRQPVLSDRSPWADKYSSKFY